KGTQPPPFIAQVLTVLVFSLLSLALFCLPPAQAAGGLLVAKNPVTDPKALLRLALPVDDPHIRQIQSSLEDIRYQLRLKRWRAIEGDVKTAQRTLEQHRQDILNQVPPDTQPQATQLLENIKNGLVELAALVPNRDKIAVFQAQDKILDDIGSLEALMVREFPFHIPDEYAQLPQLLGRATVKIVTNKGDLTVVLDGYNAPITAGNFLDLAQLGFYNHLPFTRAEESYVVQAGDPPGDAEGYLDPRTGQTRRIPLEIKVAGDQQPLYGTTLETAGRYLDKPVLPFAAYGTLAMARSESDPNSASSQFFFLLFEPELTPAGINLLDGRYAVFGYLVQGREVLEKIRAGDEIERIEILDGAQHLVNATPAVANQAALTLPLLTPAPPF
ncbi:MAG: peptidylprolyl isomerase, partial [Gloeomargarita sp. DG_1_4_bins_134]